MLNKFKRFLTENDLLKPDNRILLAVSGGIDSMVMTHLFLRLKYETGIAHCNFSLRGDESDMDEEMVQLYAQKHCIPFYSKKFKTQEFAQINGLSIQMAARELRYTWFEELRIENKYDVIAVAHNMNDNIETLLINLTRGTGLNGLSGIRPRINNIIRPLLFATRDEIIKYCHKNIIHFREDSSNEDTKYTRNKIRLKIIPILKEINPSIEITLNDTAERFSNINDIVSEYISILKERVSNRKDDLILFNISLLREYLKNKTVLFELFKQFGIHNVQLDDLIKVINGKTGGQITISDYLVLKNRKELIVSKVNAESKTFLSLNSINELLKAPGIISATISEKKSNREIPSDSNIASLDSDKISFPLLIRKWEKGDYFYPFGMDQRKKLSDYFIDRKYTRFEKERKLILLSDGKIVWIIGDRIDNRFRISHSTKKVLTIISENSQKAGSETKL
jgi:tRNA(Ile)-lysidine synthase